MEHKERMNRDGKKRLAMGRRKECGTTEREREGGLENGVDVINCETVEIR